MARKRNPDNEGLPKRWRWKKGAYRYLVPKGQEDFWDGKTEFKLGVTLSDAYQVFGARIESTPDDIQTFAHLFDHYAVKVTPTKAPRTQIDEQRMLGKLRQMIGRNKVEPWKPKHSYKLRNKIKETAKKSGEKFANRHMALLKHVFTKAVEWGVIDDHPMKAGNFKMYTEEKSKLRTPSIEEILDSIDPYNCPNPMLRAFVLLKLITGLRMTDILGITMSDITSEYLTVVQSKTRNTTGKTLKFKMTDLLKQVIDEAKAYPANVLSPYLFKTDKGSSYLKEDNTCHGFQTIWQYWQNNYFPPDKQYSVRSLRKANLNVGDLKAASIRGGHASLATTIKHYIDNVSIVVPIEVQLKQ